MKARPAVLGVLVLATVAGLCLGPRLPAEVLAAQEEQPEPTPSPSPSPSPSPTPWPSPTPPPQPIPAPAPSSKQAQAPAPKGTKPAPVRSERALPADDSRLAQKVAKNPESPTLLNELGNRLVQSGRLEEGAELYRKALKIEPEMAIVWNNLGVAYMALGRPGDAMSAYRRAIKESPQYAMAYYNLGVVYDQQDQYDDAIESYQKAIELDPGLLDVRNNPQVASNHHLAAVLVKSYLDRGGSVFLPVQSLYPAPRKKEKP